MIPVFVILALVVAYVRPDWPRLKEWWTREYRDFQRDEQERRDV